MNAESRTVFPGLFTGSFTPETKLRNTLLSAKTQTLSYVASLAFQDEN